MKLHTVVLLLGSMALAASEDKQPAELHPHVLTWQEQDAWMNQAETHYETLCHDEVCTDIWEPVCGCTCDGIYCRTFASECQLRVYNCRNTPDYNFNRNGTCDECPGWKPTKRWGSPDLYKLEHVNN